MGYSIKEKITRLLNEVSNIETVRAVGQTGDINFIVNIIAGCKFSSCCFVRQAVACPQALA